MANFPDAELLLNQMLASLNVPGAVARVRLGDGPWQELPGVEVSRMLDGEVRSLTIDSVTVPVE